jgi:hypothetical protein
MPSPLNVPPPQFWANASGANTFLKDLQTTPEFEHAPTTAEEHIPGFECSATEAKLAAEERIETGVHRFVSGM